MQQFKFGKQIFEGVQALEQVSQKPKAPKPARKGPFAIEDGKVHVSSDKFATDFLKLVKFCKDHEISDVVINGTDYGAYFKISTDVEEAAEQATSQFLRERGVAAAIGSHRKVAITAGPQNRLYGYLSLEQDLPSSLAAHATMAVDETSSQIVHRVMTAATSLGKDQITSSAIDSAYRLYDVLKGLKDSGESVTVCHQIGGEYVPAYKIWRPDSGIGTHSETSFKRIEANFFTGEPALLKMRFGVGLNYTLTAIVTPADYEPSDIVVKAAPFVNARMEGTLPFPYLRSTYDVEQRVAQLAEPQDHYTLLIDQRPAAKLYGPKADIKTGLQANYPWSRIQSVNKFESLAALFHRAGGSILVVPEYFESLKPNRIAILTPLQDKTLG